MSTEIINCARPVIATSTDDEQTRLLKRQEKVRKSMERDGKYTHSKTWKKTVKKFESVAAPVVEHVVEPEPSYDNVTPIFGASQR